MNDPGLILTTDDWHYGRQCSLPLKGLSPFTLFSLCCCPPPQLAKALLREGKQEHRRAGRLSSQTRATFRQTSRQVLASQARRQEMEEAELVRMRPKTRPPNTPISSWPPSQQGAVQAFPPAPDGCRAECLGAADLGIAHLPGEGRPGLVGAARQAG